MQKLLQLGRFTLLFFGVTVSFITNAALQLQGPVYPPPGGVTFSSAGGEMGRAGGRTWYFTNTIAAATNVVYWGPTNNGVAMSFVSPGFSGPEIMTFNPGLSSLNAGIGVWTGQTVFPSGP